MNKIKILIVGLAAVSAASLCSGALREIPVVVPAEKVVAFDDVKLVEQDFNIALCDVELLKAPIALEREAVQYAVSEPSIAAGRVAVDHAKRSAHGRMCSQAFRASHAGQPLTDYEQRT